MNVFDKFSNFAKCRAMHEGFIYLSVCLFVCLSVSNFKGKLLGGINPKNSYTLGTTQKRNRRIFGEKGQRSRSEKHPENR